MAVSRDITAVPRSYVMVAPRDVILEGGIPCLRSLLNWQKINAEKKKVGKMAAASHDLAYRLSALAPLCILYD